MQESREEKPAWQSLVTKFDEQPLIYLKAVLRNPSPNTTLIKASGIYRATVFCVCLSFGLFMIIGPFVVLDGPRAGILIPWDKIPRPILQGCAVLLGMLFLCIAAFSVFARNSLLIDGNRNLVTIRWGIPPFSQSAEFSLDRLSLVLYQLNKRQHRRPALGLDMHSEYRRVLIASSKWRSDLAPLFESMKIHFGHRFVDKTMGAATKDLGSGEVVRTPIRAELARGRSRSLHYKSDTLYLQTKRAEDKLLLLSPVLTAIFAFSIDFWFGPFEPMLRWSLAMGVLILGVAVFFAHCRTIVLMRNDWMQLHGCAKEGFSVAALHSKDVVGVQICTATGKGEYIPFLHIHLKDFPVYQVNLVVRVPMVCRVNLMTDTNISRAYGSAMEVAQFLNVPVIDHRT